MISDYENEAENEKQITQIRHKRLGLDMDTNLPDKILPQYNDSCMY